MTRMTPPLQSTDHKGSNLTLWATYACSNCGGVVLAEGGSNQESEVRETWPKTRAVKDGVPEKAANFLRQAMNSGDAPDGAVMLTASAVDAMLKDRGYGVGSLYARIEKAAEDHLITNEMALWAHEVRLDANDQRHADEAAQPATAESAKRVIDFATALAEFMFVLPARVRRGRKIEPATGTVALQGYAPTVTQSTN
jgi:Domain of unknown function (DUF4145)